MATALTLGRDGADGGACADAALVAAGLGGPAEALRLNSEAECRRANRHRDRARPPGAARGSGAVLVVAGGAAIGVAAPRALFVLIKSHLLFVASGAVALVLLALGAAMALLREQVQEVRTGLSDSRREWN